MSMLLWYWYAVERRRYAIWEMVCSWKMAVGDKFYRLNMLVRPPEHTILLYPLTHALMALSQVMGLGVDVTCLDGGGEVRLVSRFPRG